MEKNILIDDINFLGNPIWTVTKRNVPEYLLTNTTQGKCEIKSPDGLPVRFDKLVLYFMLHKLFKDNSLLNTEIITTRYEIAKNVFTQDKNFSKAKYQRIMLALKKWKSILMKFEGSFFNADNCSQRYFSIIDSIKMNENDKKLHIKFNDIYIKQIRESKKSKVINFDEYRKLTRPITVRLYELLLSELDEKTIWSVTLDKLGSILTLRKQIFPSYVVKTIQPALDEINKKTALHICFKFNESENVCTFQKTCLEKVLTFLN